MADAILYDGEATVVRPGSDVGGAWRDSSRTQLNHVEGEVRPLAPFVKAEVGKLDRISILNSVLDRINEIKN